ncbi:hypothetical protein [Streptomyces sp. NPDC029041]|uniref:hypothetical protein n=1 Tax=Streptomyces sp. NPDC029041 TaxID=3155727 RepID=UPI0033FFDCAA
MNSTIKRSVTAAAAVVMAAAGIVAAGPQASANPAVGTNIRGKESFNTDTFMDKLCGDISTRDKAFVFNVHTGEVVDSAAAYEKKPYYQLVAGDSHKAYTTAPYGTHWALSPGWEVFGGTCEYPQSSTWTWYDKERKISNDTVTNCGSGTASLSVNESYATTSTTTKTVGVNAKASAKVRDIYTGEVGASFNYSWAFSKTHTLGRQATISVPPGRQGYISARPLKRTVRVNPVFHVGSYTWSDGQSEKGTTVHNWRGRGYDRIWSYGFFTDGIADVTNSDGTPAMDYVTRDKAGRC